MKAFTRLWPGRCEACSRGTGRSSSRCGSLRRHSPPSKFPPFRRQRTLKGFDRLVAGEDGVEFIPVNNPLAVFSGGSMTLELRQKGKPAGGQLVALVRRIDGFASVQERTTDDKGRVTFAIGPADFYLARVKIDEESPRPDGQKDKSSYESTYVFQVFNRP